MAACSERELERKSPFSSKPFTTLASCLQYSENAPLKSSKMSKTAEANQNTQAINSLSDEDFENLLKDAYQDRKLKNTDNLLLKSIIQECEEKDKEDIDDLTFLTDIFQNKKSKHSSKIKNDHSHKKRLEDLLPGKTKNCIINVSNKHSSLSHLVLPDDCLSEHLSCRNVEGKDSSFVGAKTKGDMDVTNHFDSSKDLSSVNSSPNNSGVSKSCDTTPEQLQQQDSGIESSSKLTPDSLDIEMQELKPRCRDLNGSFLEDSWVKDKSSFSLHHRRRSDGDGSKDYQVMEADACCMKSDAIGMASQKPLHKSASDFSVRDSSDILNKSMDINGNPMKCGRQHSSRQMSEFSNYETTKSEGKAKQANKKNQKGVVTYQSEEVENFRGNLNLEQLISFINHTSGKKGEKLSKTLSSLESKNRHNDAAAADLKKLSSKALQNKNILKGPRRQQTSDSEDKASGEKENSASPEREIPNGLLKSEPPSNRTTQTSDKSASSILANSSPISEDVSGFAADFYTFSDAPAYEEEFRVVTKKHRKRRQNKKTDSFRKHNSSSGSNGNILRDLKQDTHRRKSTSSMPPSENSSADNSDLDSVYSLPVSGSVPQTTIRPHTTPSSMSSTPQTSYADITRMSMMNSKEREGKPRPIGKLLGQTSPGDCANGENGNSSLKFNVVAARREKHASSTPPIRQPPGFLRSTKESVTQTEPAEINIPPNNENQIKFEKPPPAPHPAEAAKPDCAQIEEEVTQEVQPTPPVTMEDFSIPPTNDYNISFGFDFNELELIYLYDRNGAKELPLPLLPKIRDNTTKLLGSEESSERTNVVSDHRTSSSSPLNSGHFHDKQDFEKSAQSFNYHQLVNYFKSKWGLFHPEGNTVSSPDGRIPMPVIKYAELSSSRDGLQ